MNFINKSLWWMHDQVDKEEGKSDWEKVVNFTWKGCMGLGSIFYLAYYILLAGGIDVRWISGM